MFFLIFFRGKTGLDILFSTSTRVGFDIQLFKFVYLFLFAGYWIVTSNFQGQRKDLEAKTGHQRLERELFKGRLILRDGKRER